ncbi:DUF4429 domain-containing protein [Streptomyces olivoreticuli]|uniref:DUF4429 domain-containing protein n=1 Tax=Streptomyces olivoreticuli TaxID=68246 RepID=UPI000E260ED6|nr:DUF4429 domain-containing protein [Streptomyces olivoreticuli]
MAEIFQKDGTWTFDGATIRIVPGRERGVHLARQTLGELAVPLAAVAGVSFEPGRKGGRLRLRLRDGADPLLQATRGQLPEGADPYQLAVDPGQSGVAEYLVDEVRNALVVEQVPDGPTDRYLLPGPAVPLSVGAGDGTVSFDGERVGLEWNWKTDEDKRSAGPRSLALSEIAAVEWQPARGLDHGHLRFFLPGGTARTPPKTDPHAIELYGFKKDLLMALVAAAVTCRLPHPSAPRPALTGEAARPESDHDALLRRLRELGELHRLGVLTEEEFSAAKQAVIKRF